MWTWAGADTRGKDWEEHTGVPWTRAAMSLWWGSHPELRTHSCRDPGLSLLKWAAVGMCLCPPPCGRGTGSWRLELEEEGEESNRNPAPGPGLNLLSCPHQAFPRQVVELPFRKHRQGATLQKTQGVLLLFIPALPSLIYCHLFAGPQGQWAGRGPRPACYYPGKCSLQNDDPADKPHIEESPAGKQSLAPDPAQHYLPSQEVASGCSEGSWGHWIPTSCPAPSSSPGREADPEPIYAH